MKGQTFDKVSFALRFKTAHVVAADLGLGCPVSLSNPFEHGLIDCQYFEIAVCESHAPIREGSEFSQPDQFRFWMSCLTALLCALVGNQLCWTGNEQRQGRSELNPGTLTQRSTPFSEVAPPVSLDLLFRVVRSCVFPCSSLSEDPART